MPYFEQSPPTAASQPGKLTFWCVNVSWMSCMFTPRSVAKLKLVRLMPTSTRPLPRVAARSAKMAPADVDVRSGTPPSKRNVSLPLVEPIGMALMLWPSASPMSEMSVPFSALDAGMKCSPCTWSDAGLFGSPEPARKSGSWPSPKMKRSEIRWRRFCACVGAARTSDARMTARLQRAARWCAARESIGEAAWEADAVLRSARYHSRHATVRLDAHRRPRPDPTDGSIQLRGLPVPLDRGDDR